jgi:hypothetical protein
MQASGTILPKSIADKAISYTLTRWEKLTRFIEHSVIELSTNWAKNSIRPIAIGRRNWLHLGSKEAGPKIAAIFSIVESCRKLNVPIRNYLADVLPGVADRSIQSLNELTPTAYSAKAAYPRLPRPVNTWCWLEAYGSTNFLGPEAAGGPPTGGRDEPSLGSVCSD